MRFLLIAAFVAVFSYPAFAADISPTWYGTTGYDSFEWNQVNNDDTTEEVLIKRTYGLYQFSVEGTEGNVELELQHGKTSGALEAIDADSMPDGVVFTSASTGNKANVCLSGGYVDIVFNSAGNSTQDVDIWMNYMGDC